MSVHETIGYNVVELTTSPTKTWYQNNNDPYVAGYIYEWGGNHYWFMKCADVAITAGWLVEFSTTSGSVTADRAGGTSAGRLPAGFACRAVPVGKYSFFQISGIPTSSGLTDGSVAAAEKVMPHATTNGGLDTMAAGSEESACGQAFAADASTVQTAGTMICKGMI